MRALTRVMRVLASAALDVTDVSMMVDMACRSFPDAGPARSSRWEGT
jgi:hypothetical protein